MNEQISLYVLLEVSRDGNTICKVLFLYSKQKAFYNYINMQYYFVIKGVYIVCAHYLHALVSQAMLNTHKMVVNVSRGLQ